MALRKLSKQAAIQLAADLAIGLEHLSVLATKYGLCEDYMRQIACGNQRPEVRRMADEIANENIRTALRVAKSMARGCMAELVKMAQNKPDPNDPKKRRQHDSATQRLAAVDVLTFATRDLMDMNTTVHKHEGGITLLTDVLRDAGVNGLDDPRLGRLDDWEPTNGEASHAGGNGKVDKPSAGENGNGNGSSH